MQCHHVDVYNRVEFPQLFRAEEDSSGNQSAAAAKASSAPSAGIGELLGAVKLPNKVKRTENVLAATTAWVIEENQPLNSVEKPAFRRMLETIDPFCPKTTIKAVRNDISYLGLVSREALKRELKGKYFSLTTDHWTSPNDETYSCLTAHWIENGKMHQAVLTFEVFTGTTTGVALGEDFVRVFNMYEFDLKYVVAVVTDTTGNMNTFGEYLRQRGVKHLYCVDHVLHLNAKLAYVDSNLPGSGNAMKAARSLEYFTKSTQAMGKILRQQAQNEHYEGKIPLKPLQDVVTRWWSTYRMLSRLRYLQRAIQVLVVNESIVATDLTPDQYEILHDVENLLKPTAEAQKYLEGEKYPTISLVPFFLHSIRRQYKAMAEDNTKSGPVLHLSGVLLQDFEKRYLPRSKPVFSTEIRRASGRYQGIPSDTIIASALDPRTKNLRPFIPDNEHDAIWSEVLNLMVQLRITNMPSSSSVATVTAVDSVSHRPVQQARLDDGAGTGCMFDELTACNQEQDAATMTRQAAVSVEGQEIIKRFCSDELGRYRHAEVSLPMFCPGAVGERQFSDPLMWWEGRKIAYPNLYVLAQRFLSIPATSAPSERLWSLASRIVTIRRARLESTLIGDLMFIKENSMILSKHFADIAGETRILPKVYPAGDENEDNNGGDDDVVIVN
ncbi:hypothetical protein ACHAWU_002078 [Discostella pseudostelligera]|uniref:HAT C-terminal dimerisation domain-containing protein n=1 Tax=Discostella pseudostelligera TaxID=259834 RepID=A0ABD3MAP2_9STRA